MTSSDADKENSLAATFAAVSRMVSDSSDSTNNNSYNDTTSTEIKLKLYGLYKRVVNGPCPSSEAPPIYRVTAYAKHQAWTACSNLSKKEAMQEYIDLVAQQTQSHVGQEASRLVHGELRENIPVESEPSAQSCMQKNKKMVQEKSDICVIPRGHLDIAYNDLLFAATHCLLSSTNLLQNHQRYYHYEQKIINLWQPSAGPNVIPGFSARTLLDLYLRIKRYPAGSQIILSPPITVPGIEEVLRHHQMEIIPVDMPDDGSHTPFLSVDMGALENAITDRTVAIMVVHIFGMRTTRSDDMQRLHSLCTSRGMDLIEDCAECFGGLPETENDTTSTYLGSPYSDLVLFSFGFIKTATALGGGVAIVRDNETYQSMNRLLSACYLDCQSEAVFFAKLCKACLIRFVTDHPFIYGLLIGFFQQCGLDFETFATALLRGFKNSSGATNGDYMAQIRLIPCSSMLALTFRRMKQGEITAELVSARRKHCEQLVEALQSQDIVKVPRYLDLPDGHAHWLFPVFTEHSKDLCTYFTAHGLDATHGASQLRCIGDVEKCPRAHRAMEQIMYLPMSTGASARWVSTLPQLIDQYAAGKRDAPEKFSAKNLGCLLPFWVVISLALLLSFVFGTAIIKFCIKLSITVMWAIAILCVTTQFLRWKMASSYLENSNSFAKYSYLFDAPSRAETELNKDLGILDKSVPDVEYTDEPERSILITGVTGFVGSTLLRDLLSYRQIYAIKRIFVIIRSKRGISANERMLRLLENPIFSCVLKDDLSSIIHVLEGDTSQANAGLSAENLEMLKNDRFITHVYNCAATVSFTQTLKEAAESNISSVLNLQGLSSLLPHKDIKFVHISTAFVHGDQTGTRDNPLGNNLFDMTPYDPFEVYKSMCGTQYYATKAMNDLGFSNAYQLSKCVSEHLLQKSSLSTIIIRPSIVGPAACVSLAGWAGSRPSTITAAPCLYFSYQWNIWSFGDHAVPCIPVDVLARFIARKTICPRLRWSSDSEEDRSLSSDEDYEKVSSAFGNDYRLSDAHDDPKPQFAIHVAAWDVSSPASSQFTWLHFAFAITQAGAILGYFSRSTAYIGLWVATRLLPRKLSHARFKKLHRIFVESSFNALLSFYAFCGYSLEKEKSFRRFLDLPVLFFPFMNSSFFFSSDLVAPQDFNGERYMMICLSSALRFLRRDKNRDGNKISRVAMQNVAYSEQCSWIQTCFWASMQPRGSIATRVAGLLLRKLLSSVFSSVMVDLGGFCDVIRDAKQNTTSTRIVLAPTHRSFFDFLLLSYVCFALPELGLELPYIIAANDFERLPVLGVISKLLGALFVRRGRGRKDPSLDASLDELPINSVLELFIEGTRSRDRRFVRPKTGVLRCLTTKSESGCIVPITISYEKIPEQLSLVEDISKNSASDLSTQGLSSWVAAAASGRIQLGKVLLSSGGPVALPSTQEGIEKVVVEIQRKQASQVLLSTYHLSALAQILDLSVLTVKEALYELGGQFWPLDGGKSPPIPSDRDELWTVALQASAYLAPLFYASRPFWAKWLFLHVEDSVDEIVMKKSSVSTVMMALQRHFDDATDYVKDTFKQLDEKGFPNPSASHVLHSVSLKKKCPMVLAKAVISNELADSSMCGEVVPSLIAKIPSSSSNTLLSSGERLGFWGFNDSFFIVEADECGEACVTMIGERYSFAGKQLGKLIPFLQRETGLSVNLFNESFQNVAANGWSSLSALSSESKEILQKYSWKVSFDNSERVRHGTGHSLADIWDVRNRTVGRVPDAVVWPSSEDQVAELISLARSQNWCLIPYGGGTNVSQATNCPSIEVEPRPIISVDMTEMRQVLAIDEENEVAHVQCGITGRELVQEMKRHGYTIGHQPDSYEFSTLGGWIATKASGMKRNKYGNIEDIVISVRVAGPEGIMTHGGVASEFSVWGRESTGLELLSIVLGSEGCLGIVTSAVIRIWPLSKVQDYDSVLLPSFDHGLSFVRDVQRMGSRGPASIRLLDNDHFRLGRALQPNSDSILESLKHRSAKLFLNWKNFDLKSAVCTTILYEGSQEEVDFQKQTLKKLICLHDGLSLGAAVGEQGYNFTFLIAYLRDFALTYKFLGDSFETFVPWSRIKVVVNSVKDRIRKEHANRCLPGSPFVGCRVTQLYHEGVCLYFYFSMSSESLSNPTDIFLEIEHAAREEILRLGGSLSHHHGIGKARSDFLDDIDSPQWVNAKRNLKRALDPENIFGAQNSGFAEQSL